ncbi:MAG: N-6 DNA methylase, partial [Planctomycetaceae bacterium]|nr:N-6 DNA methylase [Planctomycetaceae bacterium]
RRHCGAHYTTEENIMKVIRPLFLEDLRAEFEKCKSNKNKLQEFHKKLSSLTLFDPACGCGNFLVLAYRELRLLEMDVLEVLFKGGQKFLGSDFVSQVDVNQFYGIEIVEFPVRIAETALWLMDHQMNVLASERFGQYYVRLPLTKSAKIVHGNALRIDWNDVLPKEKCSYILGNPPYVGKQFQSPEQKEDMALVLGDIRGSGILDYVACWYFKAAEYIQNTSIHVGFVSTNSVVQGEQVGLLWSELFQRDIKINFGYTTFVWSSEARGKAHVHCVIVGFGVCEKTEKRLFAEQEAGITARSVQNINPYLIEGNDIALSPRTKPICPVPEIVFGSMPNDGGHLLFSDEEKKEFLKLEPGAKKWFRPFLGAEEFINRVSRWCLWLTDIPPSELRSLPEVMRRVELVKRHRLQSKRETTRELAQTPSVFGEIRQPRGTYILIPSTSSERRNFIPMGFMTARTIASNATLVVPNATMLHFGILTSTMHMDWMRRICGRLKSDYRYSAQVVYNNFPWPTDIAESKKNNVIEKAQAVLNVRKTFEGNTLADLYDPLSMPPDLAKAHRELDKAVDRCYRSKPFADEQERLEFLFDLYEKLTAKEK